MDIQGKAPTTIEQIQNAIAQKRQEIGQRTAGLPQTEANLRATLFGGDKTLSSLRTNEADAIKQLYAHDRQVASTYQPTSPEFVEDPGAKARYGSQVLAEQGGVLADLQKGIANRRDVLGDALEKGMKMAMYGLEALKQEYTGLEGERDFLFKMKEHEDEMSSKKSEASNPLPDFLQQLTQFQEKSKDVAPVKSGRTVTKAKTTAERQELIRRLNAQFPGQKLSLTFNKDGTISYTVLNPQQAYATAEEAPLHENAPETLQKILGLGIAANPKQASQMEALYKLFTPEQKQEKFGYTQWEVLAGIAGQPKTSETVAKAQTYLESRDTIRVREKTTGRTGTIPKDEFDEKIYEKL